MDDTAVINLVANCIETGQGLRNTLRQVNSYLVNDSCEPVTYSAIYKLKWRLKPRTVPIQKRRQGNKNKESKWALANFCCTLQVLICMGTIYLSQPESMAPELLSAVTKLVPDFSNPPDEYDIEKLTPIDLNRILWWDEHH